MRQKDREHGHGVLAAEVLPRQPKYSEVAMAAKRDLTFCDAEVEFAEKRHSVSHRFEDRYRKWLSVQEILERHAVRSIIRLKAPSDGFKSMHPRARVFEQKILRRVKRQCSEGDHRNAHQNCRGQMRGRRPSPAHYPLAGKLRNEYGKDEGADVEEQDVTGKDR